MSAVAISPISVPPLSAGPDVLSRVGGDLHPLDLRIDSSEKRLSACVWGDQPHRLERLREALDIHESALAGRLKPAARVSSLDLPHGLEQFLAEAVPAQPTAPVVVFNTYVTAYLQDVGQRAVARTMAEFAINGAFATVYLGCGCVLSRASWRGYRTACGMVPVVGRSLGGQSSSPF